MTATPTSSPPERRAARALGWAVAMLGALQALTAALLTTYLDGVGSAHAVWAGLGCGGLAGLAALPQRWLPRGIVVLSALTAVLAVPAVFALPWSWGFAACALPAAAWGLAGWAARRGSKPQVLLSVLPLALGILLASACELHGRHVAASWVEIPALCRFNSGEQPRLGPGGRLRANLDLRTISCDHPYLGARVVTNDQGFRNAATVPDAAPEGELRVLSLGDSFSAGYWMTQDEFFGARLEAELRERVQPQLRVLTADVMDPAHGLLYYQEFGQAFEVDVVLLGLCMNDPLQAEQFFGADRMIQPLGPDRVQVNPNPTDPGWERFAGATYPRRATPEAAQALLRAGRPQPGWRGLLGKLKLVAALQRPRFPMPSLLHSFTLSREERGGSKWLIDGSSNLGFFLRADLPEVEAILAAQVEVLQRLQRGVRAAGAELWVVLYPPKFRVHPVEWELMCRFWNLDPADFDLERWERRLAARCAEAGIGFVGLASALRAEAERAEGSLYLPLGDVHLNARGYRAAARATAEALAPALKAR